MQNTMIIENLKSHRLKVTPQRIEIANALMHYGHLSIEKLYEMMRKKFPSISLATIYKNLNIMTDSAFVQEVKIPHAKSVYELTKETHSHLVCQECGEIQDIILDLTHLSEIASTVSRFHINKADLVFSGICKNCQ